MTCTERDEATLRVRGWDGSPFGDTSLSGGEPLGFAAGDKNLYRYVFNDPADLTDPTGLQAQVVKEGENAPLKTPSYILIAPPFGPGFDKDKVYDSNPIKPTQLPRVPDPNLDTGVAPGRYKVVKNIPPGRYAGTGAASPCIGLIITDQNKKVYIYHFYNTQSPMTTLESTGVFLNGSHAAIFGGDNSPESNKTLLILMDHLRNNPEIKIDGFSNTEGLYVGADGKYYIYKTTKQCTSCSKK